MRRLLGALKKYDWFLITAIVLLAAVGLVVIYSISLHQTKVELLFKKQVLFVVVGFLTMIGVGLGDYRIFKNWGWAALLVYLVSLVLLTAVLFFWVEVRGVRSWFIVRDFGLEPVEFVKIVLILVLAKYLAISHIEIHRIQHIAVSGFYALIPAALVLIQPDLGSAIILIVLWLGLMLIAGIRRQHLAMLLAITLVVVALGWFYFLHDYQRGRIISFLNPHLDPQGIGYNRNQALIAIGSGGLWGRGLKHATQSQYGFLPQAPTDFVLAAVGETWGLVGLTAVLGLWLVIFWRLKVIAQRSSNNFAKLFIVGFFLVAMMQFFINAAVNFGLLPITGIPSPFLSYGGSGFLAFSAGIGLILSIDRLNKS